MNKNFTVVALMALIFISCDRERKIEIVSSSLTENDLSICQNSNCPEVTINYVEVFGDDKIAAIINKQIQDFITSSLLLGEERVSSAKTIQDAAIDFIESYNADKAQFPDMAGEYFAEISVNEIYNSPKHISFEMRQYLYTGGAHGYGNTSFLNIDPKTGAALTSEVLFKNKKEFTAFAELKFRQQQKIKQEQSINDTGFWFEDEKFRLPESFGFMQDSLIFVYNQYEIASYADGPIELKIAMEEAEPYLKNN